MRDDDRPNSGLTDAKMDGGGLMGASKSFCGSCGADTTGQKVSFLES